MTNEDFYVPVKFEVAGREVSNLYTIMWRYYFSELKDATGAREATEKHMALLISATAK